MAISAVSEDFLFEGSVADSSSRGSIVKNEQLKTLWALLVTTSVGREKGIIA